MTNLESGLLAAVVVLIVILTWHALTRDKEVRRTRWGVFIERDRYTEDEHEPEPRWPVTDPPMAPPDDETTQTWPKT